MGEVVAEVAGDGAEDAQDEGEDGAFGGEEGDAVDGVGVVGVLVLGVWDVLGAQRACTTYSLLVLDVQVRFHIRVPPP